MKIKQIRYSADNFSYLIYENTSALIIDGGAVEEIMAFIKKNNLILEFVVNTHNHKDHTLGNQKLLTQTTAEFIENDTLLKNGFIHLGNEKINVYHTPGHTWDSVIFEVSGSLITGDTLFNGTVGNCFCGDLKVFYNSIKQILAFPEQTTVYAGHDYLEYAMAFARIIEPQNSDIDIYLRQYNREKVSTTLAQEKKVNPYLRFNHKTIIKKLEKNSLPTKTEYDRWESVMTLED